MSEITNAGISKIRTILMSSRWDKVSMTGDIELSDGILYIGVSKKTKAISLNYYLLINEEKVLVTKYSNYIFHKDRLRIVITMDESGAGYFELCDSQFSIRFKIKE